MSSLWISVKAVAMPTLPQPTMQTALSRIAEAEDVASSCGGVFDM